MFVILQDSRNRIDYAPQNWVKYKTDGTEIVYWPKKNLSNLQCDPNSEPITEGSEKWHVVPDTVKRRNIPTVDEANRILKKMMEEITESENESDFASNSVRRTRSSPKKSIGKKVTSTIPQFNVLLQNQPKSAIHSHRFELSHSPTATVGAKKLYESFKESLTNSPTLPIKKSSVVLSKISHSSPTTPTSSRSSTATLKMNVFVPQNVSQSPNLYDKNLELSSPSFSAIQNNFIEGDSVPVEINDEINQIGFATNSGESFNDSLIYEQSDGVSFL